MPMDICLIFGAAIAFVVSLMKRVPFIRNNPRIVAGILSAAVAAYNAIHGNAGGVDIGALVACAATQFLTSVGTHQVAIKPVREVVDRALVGG